MKHFFFHSLWCLSLLCFTSLHAWSGVVVKSWQMTTAHGLPNNTVRCLMIDHKGQIWMGTQNGLACYNGNRVRTYVLDSCPDTSEVVNKKIRWIVEDNKHLIWVLTADNQVLCLEPISGTRVPVNAQGDWSVKASSVATDEMGHIQLDRVKHSNVPRGTRRLLDNKGGQWFYNGTGVLKGVPAGSKDTLTLHLMTAEQLSMIDQERYDVCCTRDGLIAITTYGAGLYLYNPHSHSLTTYSCADHNPILGSNYLYQVEEDATGNLWIAQRNAGLAHLYIAPRGIDRVQNLFAQGAIADSEILSVLPDEKGGFYYSTRSCKLFHSEKKTAGGLSSTLVAHLPSPAYTLAYHADGHLMAGLRKGGVWMEHASLPMKGGIFDLLIDDAGRTWVATLGRGLWMAAGGMQQPAMQQVGFKAFHLRVVRALSQHPRGRIWAATDKGLLSFRPTGLKQRDDLAPCLFTPQNSALHDSELNTVFVDESGDVWVGTMGNGVCRVQLDARERPVKWTYYDTTDGLASNEVQSITQSRDGKIWIATQYGLSCFMPADESFTSYFLSSTLQGDMYSINASALLTDGRLALATADGVVLIDPAQLKGASFSASPCITEVEVAGKRMVLHEQADGSLPSFDLDWEHRSLRVSYSNLDYSRFRSSLYRYRIKGLSEEWSEPDPTGEVMLTDLPQGHYVLEVMSCNSSGKWCRDATRLAFNVLPPWWRSTWAYTIYALVLVLLVSIGLLVAHRLWRMHLMVEREQEMSAFKLSLFIKLWQEFRLPLAKLKESLHAMGVQPKQIDSEVEALEQSLQQTLQFEAAAGQEESFEGRLQHVVEQHIADTQFGVEQLAEALGCGRTNCFSRVKYYTGMTPAEYIRTIRLKKAARLLLSDTLNVSQVAQMVGFDDLSHFSRSFKAYFGMSPTAFVNEKKRNS